VTSVLFCWSWVHRAPPGLYRKGLLNAMGCVGSVSFEFEQAAEVEGDGALGFGQRPNPPEGANVYGVAIGDSTHNETPHEGHTR